MQPWKTLSRPVVFDHSKWLTVEDHIIQLPNGTVVKDWPWIVSPHYVNIVPVTDNGTIYCFRQTKYAVEGVTLATIGGYLEPNEDPLDCARRELKEEMGCEAREWIRLGSYPVDGNHGNGVANLFLAKGTKKVVTPVADDLEEQQLLELSIEETERALLNGEFKVLSWTTAVAMALLYLKGKN